MLGSASDCDIQILLGNVEPTHALLDLGARGLQLSDGGSATGTYVNGEKIAARHVLSDGDRICLGPPGSKSSAKLLVRIPRSWAAPADEAEGDEVVVDADADPLVLIKPGGVGARGRCPRGRAPPPPPPPPPPPYAPPPPPAALGRSCATAASASAAARAAAERSAPAATPAGRGEARPAGVLVRAALDRGKQRRLPAPAPHSAARPRDERGQGARRKRRPRRECAPRGAFPRVAVLTVLGAALAAGGYWAATNLFRSPPEADDVMPPKTEPGRTVTITGTGFDSDPAKNTVRFGDQVGRRDLGEPDPDLGDRPRRDWRPRGRRTCRSWSRRAGASPRPSRSGSTARPR